MSNDIIPWDADQTHVLHALTRKRAEIAGQIEQTQSALDDLISELEHVDGTIFLFSPAIDVTQIKPKRVSRAIILKGTIARPMFKIFREADGPLTPREITLRLLTARRLDPQDKALVAILIKRVRVCLREQKLRGLVESTPMAGGQQAWCIRPCV